MWSPHLYKIEALKKGMDKQTIDSVIDSIEMFGESDTGPAVILTLKHLACRTKISYYYLRRVVERSSYNYREFEIRKRSGGFRNIHVPDPPLARVQKWLNIHILSKVQVHHASHAFCPKSSILNCAARHCSARWLIKVDVKNFFDSISEIQVYRCFRGIGYQPLVSFELARIVTISSKIRKYDPVWQIRSHYKVIEDYSKHVDSLGYLPQGAPTSPMISNIVMIPIDKKIHDLARSYGLVYTRYSDDMTFSTSSREFGRQDAKIFIHSISSILLDNGFEPHRSKTRVIPPGTRKIVLGLNVDGFEPKLRREFKDNIRLHLYFLEKLGPYQHSLRRGFRSIDGMKFHIRGLIDFANMIEPKFATMMYKKFNSIDWPK